MIKLTKSVSFYTCMDCMGIIHKGDSYLNLGRKYNSNKSMKACMDCVKRFSYEILNREIAQ